MGEMVWQEQERDVLNTEETWGNRKASLKEEAKQVEGLFRKLDAKFGVSEEKN